MGLQLTRGGEYAIRAMVYLASFPHGSIVSLREISRSQDIPEGFLAKILQNLVHAGLVVSRRGASGGFIMVPLASEVSLRDIVEAADGPLCLNQCILWPEDCERSKTCRLREVWLRAQEQFANVLAEVTLEELAAGAPSSSGESPACPLESADGAR